MNILSSFVEVLFTPSSHSAFFYNIKQLSGVAFHVHLPNPTSGWDPRDGADLGVGSWALNQHAPKFQHLPNDRNGHRSIGLTRVWCNSQPQTEPPI